MGEVLSQSEIDALLSAISTGAVVESEEHEKKSQLRVYDFKTANRFSKEHLRTLRLIYENFARAFATYLSGTLRTVCRVELVSAEEQKYQEFINSLPNPVVLGILKMAPLVGPTLIEISPPVAFSMINRLLGGETSAKSELSRAFTEIELVIIERLVRQFLPQVSEAWEKIISINTVLQRIETSSQFAQIVAMNETIAIMTLNVRIGDTEGLVNFVIPHLSLEGVAKQLNTRALFSTTESRQMDSATEEIRTRIGETPLVLTAEFNEVSASLYDVANLQVGDVIRLEHKVGSPLTVRVGHLPKFKASLGVKERKYAVKVQEILKEEDEPENE